MSAADLVVVLVLAPAVAAVVGLPLGRVHRALGVACGVGGALVALLASLLLARDSWDGYPVVTGVPFLGRLDTGAAPGGSALDLRVDALGGLVAVAVALVALAVQVYSAGYLGRSTHLAEDADPAPTRYAAYAATVSLFTAAMLLVVQADDLFLVLVGWEVMGLCSYLLIGHHSERPAARRAAVQAFLVTRVADVAFVIGIVVLYAATGTSRISGVLAQVDDIGTGTATLAALLLVVGVMGKSGQFPLHGWLPDAMEGPTPVSAFIHAATMVAAGVVVLARLHALLLAAPVALAALVVVATVTMVGAALAALVADDIKRVLAWSTISQVAIMLGALALGSGSGRASAVAHLLSHAAFKSLLFLAAGVLVHHAGTTALAGLHSMGRRAPWTSAAWVVGLLSLAALPPFAGFLSKEGVLTAAEHGALDGDGVAPVWVAATLLAGVGLTSVLTGAYAGRLLVLTVRRPAAERARLAELRRARPVPAADAWVDDPAVLADDPGGSDDAEDDFDLVGALDPDYHPEDYQAPSPQERERALQVAAERARREEEARLAAERAEAARVVEEDRLAALARQDQEDAARLAADRRHVPVTMGATVAVLTLVTLAVAALPLAGARLLVPVDLELVTAAVGALLAVAGLLIGCSSGPGRSADVADRLPARLRAAAASGYGYQAVQQALVVRPVGALARLVASGDRDVVDGYVAALAVLARFLGAVLRRVQTGVVTGYLSWVAGAAVLLGVVAVLVGGGS
jgi:NADH-quinone oxidoreductase subunit L